MVGFVISNRVWNIVQWPMIVIGLVWAVGLIGGLLYAVFRVVRRWPPMLGQWRIARVTAELTGVALVLVVMWLGGRVAP